MRTMLGWLASNALLVHYVLGKPLAPLGRLLGAQSVLDDDRLRFPLLWRGKYAYEPARIGIEFGGDNRWACAFDLGGLRLNLWIEQRIDELVGEIDLFGALHDGHSIDAEHAALFRDHQLHIDTFSLHIVRIHREDHLHGCLTVGDQLLAIGIVGVKCLEVRLQGLEPVLSLFPTAGIAPR